MRAAHHFVSRRMRHCRVTDSKACYARVGRRADILARQLGGVLPLARGEDAPGNRQAGRLCAHVLGQLCSSTLSILGSREMPMKSGPCAGAFGIFWISLSLTDIQKIKTPINLGFFTKALIWKWIKSSFSSDTS